MNMSIVQSVSELISPVLLEEGLNLYDVLWTKDLGKNVLRVMIEKPQGSVTLGDCSRVSHLIEDLIEVKGVIPYQYFLEVSSPGLDRPLRTVDHFSRVVGKMISARTQKPLNGRRHYKGILKSIEGEQLVLTIDNKDFLVPIHEINKAHLEIEL